MKRGARSGKKAFTILEVMMAGTVMVLAITSSIIVLQFGMRAIDNARYTTLAGQILQSQMEKLRMLNWGQLKHSTDGAIAYTTFTPDVSIAATAQLNRFTVGGVGNRCGQSITAATGNYSLNTKVITLTASWKSLDGQPHTLSYTTRYVQNGISDFFYPVRR